jgi:phosphate transport system protein
MAVMMEHTSRAFDADLQGLARMIAEMGGLAERQIGDALDALNRRDTVLARGVIDADARIDALQREIEEKAILTIARRQPMAVDLRDIVGALRVANDLERIGELVLTQIKDVLDAYARRDSGKALQVWRSDDEVDAVNNSLFRELLTYMMEDPRNISVCIHLLFCAKNIERMGDHATNIAETIYYMVEGQTLTDERPKGDSTSTINVPYRNER